MCFEEKRLCFAFLKTLAFFWINQNIVKQIFQFIDAVSLKFL